jgi:hypothetical protein
MDTESNEPKSRYRQYLEVVTGPLEDKKRWRQQGAAGEDTGKEERTV